MIFPPGIVSILLSMKTPSMSLQRTTYNRQFRFVEFGQPFTVNHNDSDEDRRRPTVACDGRIPGGVTLELTHWNGNETPDELYADTSTEMAIKLASHPRYGEETRDAFILNNHFDTDGVLSVWACLEPQQATEKYRDLLIQGAEAGDFNEWSSDDGVKLDCALTEFCNTFRGGEKAAFEHALQDLVPSLLEDVQSTGGKQHEQLWKAGYENALASWEALQKNENAHMESFNKDIAILQTTSGTSPAHISPYAIHRWLKENGLEASTKRILYACTTDENPSSHNAFHYDLVGHGWVHKLVQRPPVPGADVESLLEKTNVIFGSNSWKKGSGMLGILQTTKGLSATAKEVATTLAKYDYGLRK